MHPVLLGVVLATLGDAPPIDVSFTAGGAAASRSANGSLSAWAHVGLFTRREFEQAFVEVQASVLAQTTGPALGLNDLGSRLAIGLRHDGFVREWRLELSPFSGTRRLPVFDWANRIGTIHRDDSTAPVLAPALALDVRTAWGDAWVATRVRSIVNFNESRSQLWPDLFAGIEVRPSARLSVGARGGWFQYGLIPALAAQGVQQEARGLGGSIQLAWTWNEPVGPAVDLVTYADDPLRFERFFSLEPRESRTAAWVALEGGGATQRLVDPERALSVTEQAGWWADVQVRVRLGQLRLFATARAQAANLLTFDTPGVPPFQARLPESASLPLLAGFLGADWRWRAAGLTPGFLVTMQRQAALRSPFFDLGGTNPPPGFAEGRWFIIRPGPAFLGLRTGAEVMPTLSVRASLRWEPVPSLCVLAYLDLERDWNAAQTLEPLVGANNLFAVQGQLQLQVRL